MFDFLLEFVKLPWTGAAVMLKVVGITAVLFGTDYKFSEPAFKYSEENLYLVSRVEGGYTKKIRDLLLGATPVIIEYSVIFNSKKSILTKEISYDLFSKKFTIRQIEGQQSEVLQLSEAAGQIESVVLPICHRSLINNLSKVNLEISARAYPAKTTAGISAGELWSDRPGLKMEFNPQKLK